MWNQQICSEACKNKRQYQFWLKYQQEHSNTLKKQDKDITSSKKKKKKSTVKSKVQLLEGDPKWIKVYAEADRLTQITMLARALDDYGIAKLSYGQLALRWDTHEYYMWEKDVISRKRKEQAYDNKNTFKDLYQAAAEDRAKEKDSFKEQ